MTTPPRPAEHPRTMLVLLLGIGGWFFALLGLIAWILGDQAKKEIKNGAPYRWEGSRIRLGWLLGRIGFVLNLVLVLFFRHQLF